MGKPENTIGALKYPGVDPKNAQKVVMGLVNNGELIKQAAPMIETLKNVVNGMNPPVPMAVGVQNLTGAIKSSASLVKKAKGEQEQADPCAIENRPNLTPEQLAECERLDAIEKGDYTEKDPEPAYSTSISDEWTNYSANTVDSAAYQAAIVDIAEELAANASFVADVGATAGAAAANTPANTFTNTFMTTIMANTTFQSAMTGNTTFLTALKAALNALP